MTTTRTRLQRLMDERVTINKLHEDLLAAAEQRSDSTFTEVEEEQLKQYRERADQIDSEQEELVQVLEREEASAAASKKARAHLDGNGDGYSTVEGQTVYRNFHTYARDMLIVRDERIARVAGGDRAREAARERLMRAPANTTTDDVEGLLPPQHIQQIMDVINKSRPVVNSGRQVSLANGRLTWPKINLRPTVGVQTSEKSEVSDPASQRLDVSLEDAQADTYLGAGNLSWQAINWGTPDALALWFNLAGEAYAKATETAACLEVKSAAEPIDTQLAGAGGDGFDDWMKAISDGAATVYSAVMAMVDTLYLAPDMFYSAAALVSNTNANFINAGSLNLAGLSGTAAGLKVVVSYGFPTGTAIVGDSSALLVAETAGAPVELRAVEPAIGGLEVGVIGAFKAIAFDSLRFAEIGPSTTYA